MSPNHTLARLCRRHQVPFEDAEHLLPLVTRAVGATDQRIRRSMLNVVESTLRRLGEERRYRQNLESHLERQYLIALAAVLHRWEPRDAPPPPAT
ncbi:MAG: hypothetical protein IT453_17335 [Planctomycetes bacterium]|nr:hypothetical protein [Planctomycetota bacterium]